MSQVELYRQMFVYNRKVLETFLDRVAKMSRREATKDRGIGHGSYVRTILHIVRVHEAWLNYVAVGDLQGLHESHDRFAKMWERADLREARAYLRSTWVGIDQRMRSLTPKELQRTVKAPWMPGQYTLEDALVQSTLEQAHHIGEVIGAFWRQGAVPPQMMWIPILTGKRVSVA